jgi:AcrR family transcriptional regulator
MMSNRNAVSLKGQVLEAARKLFMERGYEAVGMRDIAEAVGKQPVQVYRLKLSKTDILAELIIELNREQIELIPALCKQVRGTGALDRTCGYLRELYKFDIQYLPIRSVGAAFGWMWSAEQERRVVEQVGQLVTPVVQWMQDAGLEDVQARVVGIWSLYYVGYRDAVIHGGSARDCLKAIKPSLRYYFQ